MADTPIITSPYPWHVAFYEDLHRRHAAGRLPHALLLGGPAGTGKLRLATVFAHSLLCQSPADGYPCGRCQGCTLAAAGSHPDRFLLAPEEGSKSIKVGQVRDFVEFCARTPQYGGYRVALVAPADSMNRNAQNALLKTLEEPGAQTLLILVSDQPSRLLPTVRSRCQAVSPGLPDAADSVPWLTELVGEEALARALLAAAGQAPLRARDLEHSAWFAERDKLLRQCLNLVAGRQSASQVARALLEHDSTEILEVLTGWLAAAARQASGGAASPDPRLAEGIAQLAQHCPAPRLLTVHAQCLEARRLLASGANPNAELLLEQILLSLAGVDVAAAGF
ncbi:MAG: DNA polymerase III subunit delta' [Alcanivoracaceae bacterium]|jgi:DNA polymerase-3 subunit delta'|nr:DNA polymerase III subunit delta' [Alcanivoracaceae bacterium]